ncbi:prefoldin beta-like protein [Phaffia rhodozyma]|uniref:Prefoldin beta-like protein n=1 Tax=Phaffia rhodozyma TaxID=264483 RepID=A0A0F7SM99_PHARH|nr:prefoldin beta-like protein [Phaffia rhodozyma]
MSAKKLSDQEVNQIYQRSKNELQGIAQKIGELEGEADEYSLVLSTLLQTEVKDPNRKCFRLIGGVLVERTVKDVVPDLKTNSEGIKSVLSSLITQYKTREEEFEKFTKDNGIRSSTVQRA